MPKLYDTNDTKRASGAPSVNNEPGRSAYRKDYARLLHAPSFRRLQGKTQLFPGDESDFFRNRLTHSLEVAQIAAGIAESLNATAPQLSEQRIDTDLVQFAAIAHDLGHPPFGHNGEQALDEIMRPYGGFEGNAQTLRILTAIEKKLVNMGADMSADYGLDLTYRTLASVLKYDNEIPQSRPENAELVKGYYATEAEIVKKIKSNVAPDFEGGKFKTLECSIMDLADDIAYSTYDLEDSLHARFVSPVSLIEALQSDESIQEDVLAETNKVLAKQGYEPIDAVGMLQRVAEIFGFEKIMELDKELPEAKTEGESLFVTRLRAVNYHSFNENYTRDELLRTRFTADRIGRLISEVELEFDEDRPAFSSVKLTRNALLNVEILKHLNYALVIRSPRLAIVQYRGKDIVREIFDAIMGSEGALLSGNWKTDFKAAADDDVKKYRVVCDFISGMTDNYAVEYHNSLFGNGKNIYKPL